VTVYVVQRWLRFRKSDFVSRGVELQHHSQTQRTQLFDDFADENEYRNPEDTFFFLAASFSPKKQQLDVQSN